MGRRKYPWAPPAGMDPLLAAAVRDGLRCGAAVGNKFCTGRSAVKGGPAPQRCRRHGGSPKRGLVPGFKALGLYSSAVLPGEEELAKLAMLKGDSLDEEIATMRMRLSRLLAREAEQRELEDEGAEELLDRRLRDETVVREVQGDAVKIHTARTHERIDWSHEVDRVTKQLVRLMERKAATKTVDVNDDERRQLVRETIAAMKKGLGLE